MFYCLVAGSRTFTDYSLMCSKLDKLLVNQSEVTIVQGGALGADTYAIRYAKERGYECITFKANWDKYGKSAGYRRNKQMHRYIAQFPNRGCVCFWDGTSKGTAHNFKLAEQFNNPLRVVKF